MSFIIIGDTHLGGSKALAKSSIGLAINSRVSDQLEILDWCLDQAMANNCSDIFITGDVFEEPKPEPMLIKLFISWLKRCEVHETNVHIILGNHDFLRTGNTYSSPLNIISAAELPRAFVYEDTATISLDNTGVTIMPFKDRKSLFEASNAGAVSKLKDGLVYELAGIPAHYNKVVIGHLAIEGSIYVGDEIDDIANELFCPVSMFNGYDHVWMGHVHSPQTISKASPYVAHIGSMDISNFGEAAHKKHIVIYDTDSGSFTAKNIPTRDLQKLSIDIPENCEDPTEFVLSQLSTEKYNKSIVRLDINTSSITGKPVNKSVVEQRLKDLGAFSISGISETKKQKVLVKKENAVVLDKSFTIPSAINKYAESLVDAEDREDFINLSLEILSSLES